MMKSSRRKPTKSRVRAQSIIKGFNIGKNSILSSRAGVKPIEMNQLTFEATEEIFSNNIVVRIVLTGHALPEVKLKQTKSKSGGNVLDAPVGMENLTLLSRFPAESHVECVKCKLCTNAVEKA